MEPLRTFSIVVSIKIPGFCVIGPACKPWNNLLREAICGALEAKGIMAKDAPRAWNDFAKDMPGATVTANEGQTLGLFNVTEFEKGLRTVRAQMAHLALLPFSEIGYLDNREEIWRCYHPSGQCTLSIDPIQQLNKWVDAYGRQNS